MGLIGDCVTLRGDEHPVCQDSSAIVRSKDFVIAAISDGHGRVPHIRSGWGSKTAVTITSEILEKKLTDSNFVKKFVHSNNVEKNILVKKIFTEEIIVQWWHDCISNYEQYKLNENELTLLENEGIKFKISKNEFYTNSDKIEIVQLYGATLLIVVVHKDFSFGIQIGDGAIIALDSDGTVNFDCTYMDDECNDNVTTSLCQPTNNLRSFVHEKENIPIAYALYSDGLEKSYKQSDISKIFCGSLCTSQIPSLWYGSMIRQLEECTHSKTRSGDDTSFAYIFNDSINLNRLYEKTFKLKSPNISINKSYLPKRKICYDGEIKNGELVEEISWIAKSGREYKGTLCNGMPKSSVYVENSLFKCPIEEFELSGSGTEFKGEHIIYKGPFECGQYVGIGELFKEYNQIDYCQYKGEFVKGTRTGKGTEYYPDGKIKYIGEFKNGNYCGKGSYFNISLNKYYLEYEGIFSKNFDDFSGTAYYNSGNIKFKGSMKRKQYQEGIVYRDDTTNSKQFDGKYYNNLLHDVDGIEYFDDGVTIRFRGKFISGKPNGMCKENDKSGNLIYEGLFLNGLYETDNGKIYEKGNLIYEGRLKEGLYEGKGIKYYPNGKIMYKGSFKKGEFSGTGTYYDLDGNPIYGNFKNGKYVKK